MTTAIKFLTAMVIIILMSSFTDKYNPAFTGTYGVSAADASQIKLTINADHTFYYQDFSIPDKKMIINGNWTLNGKKILLADNHSKKNFHNVWTFEENGAVAKSRKGLTFYRLCKIAD